MNFLRKYATATVAGKHFRIPLLLAGESGYADGGDWTPQAGDVKVSLDGGTLQNIATLPSYVNGAWQFQASDAELTAQTLEVQVTAVEVESDFFIVETYGHASAMFVSDISNVLALGALVDTIPVEELLAAVLAVSTNVAERISDTEIQFKKRDGTTTIVTITYGAEAGERTASVIA